MHTGIPRGGDHPSEVSSRDSDEWQRKQRLKLSAIFERKERKREGEKERMGKGEGGEGNL